MTVRLIANPDLPVSRDTVGHVVFERFRAEVDCLSIAVVDADRRPVGLVERNAFFLKSGAEHGRALWAGRPIQAIMDDDPLIVDAEALISDFTAHALSSRPSDLLRGFIVTSRGLYIGVGSILALLRHSNAASRKHAQEMATLADQLARANADAQQARAFLGEVIENIPAIVFVKSPADGRFMLMNREGERVLGLARQSLIGRREEDVFPGDSQGVSRVTDEALIEGARPFTVEEQLVRGADGGKVLLRTKKVAVKDEAGRAAFILGVSEDVTERRRSEALVARMAHYDALTELPNRVLFRREIEAALEASLHGAAGSLAVHCLDLDRFKTVNDTLGHQAGDALLQMVAARLATCIRAGDCVARLGGDEFAIIQNGIAGEDDAIRLARRIVDVLAEPYDLDGLMVVIGASVGIAISPAHATNADDLLKKADMALYRAKSKGRGRCDVFRQVMDDALQRRRAIEVDLREALARDELELHYQPIFDIVEGCIVGQEALLRWRHRQRGLELPAEFIPVAEDTGLIEPIGRWVLREACLDAAAWPGDPTLAVNISAVQFRSRTLVRDVVDALSLSGLAPHRLELEITESVLLAESAVNIRVLHQLRDLGVRISMDDFGTGYSSLSYLRQFPFDKIKIDQSFIRDLADNNEALEIVRAVVNLGAGLGVTVTAEGVETNEQLTQLRNVGCVQVQGYLLGRPRRLPGRADVSHAKRVSPTGKALAESE
jgi:diguanylate cyclase (GGDEF)-like protein/PAS domain S-box-containing protein